MKKLVVLFVLLAVIVSSLSATATSRKSLVMAHYLPIYQSKEVSGYWGPHWTMQNCNPDKVAANGRRETCTSEYPIIGAYDSNDKDVLEYHVLLMKLSGIDGVIFDWHAIHDYWPVIPRFRSAVESMIPLLEKAGMKFSIMYEDRTMPLAVQYTYVKKDETLKAGQEVMKYILKNYFNKSSYLKVNGKPMLFNWGPVFFHEKSQWDSLLSVFPNKPVLSMLDWGNPASDIGFAWTQDTSKNESMDQFYNRFYQEAKNRNWSTVISSAYPGFKDFYKQGGWGESIGNIPYNNGDTLRKSLDWARKMSPDILQLVTWNDFGEGTAIEPTEEFGNSFLEQVQGFTQSNYSANDLEIPLRLFNLRKQNLGNAQANESLDQVFEDVVSGNISAADSLLQVISAN
jgi:glycoprotein endo-alpha-1,2-mannosidase